jgi:SagB-type dehydrogenase family enzyme
LQLCREWSTYGWVDTADYQLATIDYPFADYATDGREIDFQRMRTYVQDEPDIDRGKRYADAIDRIPVPSTSNALGELTDRFVDVWQGDAPLKNLTKDRCLTLLSSVFGILRRRPLADSPDLIASAVGKTSPSGGSRHPTEAYLFACSVEGLSTGAYHFNAEDASLDLVAELDTGELALARMFSGPMRASFQIDAFVVMTSVFDRSMWRYREPRSFRAVYMDVGHLCGTLDVVARTLGLNCLVQHGLSETPIAKMLRTQPLTEGVIYGAALGGSHRGTQ